MMSNTSIKEEDSDTARNYPQYTLEQKIVTAVWVHERPYNSQSFDDIQNNFCIRFKMAPPKRHTMVRWENTLFKEGTFQRKSKRPPARLVHVPYVKASFREKPNLTFTERANQLGLARSVLRSIIKYDLKDSDMNKQKSEGSQDGDSKSQDSDNQSEDSDNRSEDSDE